MQAATLIGLPPSSYTRTAMMILEAKGADYTFQPAEFRSESHLALHPFAKIPALKHGDVQLFETLAIAVYVDESFDGPALQPTDALAKAQMMQWISVINDYIYDSLIKGCVFERFVKPMRGMQADEAAIADLMPVFERHLDILNEALLSDGHLVGQISLADHFLAPILNYFAATPEGKALLPARANLSTWLEKMRAMEGFERINTMG